MPGAKHPTQTGLAPAITAHPRPPDQSVAQGNSDGAEQIANAYQARNR